jgi:hypothetical protein
MARASSARSAGESHTRSKRPAVNDCSLCTSVFHPVPSPWPRPIITAPTTTAVITIVAPNHTKMRR